MKNNKKNIMSSGFRKPTLFEKLLLIVGISVGFVGFWLINSTYKNESGMSWDFISAVFLWLLLIFVIILTDSNESIKEDLSIIIKKHIEETKLLKKEIKIMNNGKKKK